MEVTSPEAVFAEIAQRIVRAVDPEKIIVYGSWITNPKNPKPEVDIMIIKDGAKSLKQTEGLAYRAMYGLGVPVNIECYTTQDLKFWLKASNNQVSRAFEQGRILYSRGLG